jgi:hypothetical protein
MYDTHEEASCSDVDGNVISSVTYLACYGAPPARLERGASA